MVLSRLTRVATLLCGCQLVAVSAVSQHGRGQELLQSWSGLLEGDAGKNAGSDTPVTRVVSLLKEMGKTVKAEMDEDEGLFRKLQCWCNDNNWAKGNAVESSESTIAELHSTIESLTGSTAELRISIKELEAEFASDKQALAEATALREKQINEFHNMEKDDVQNIENLKAALEVLAKHHSAPPESTVAGGAIFKSERDSWSSLVQTHKDLPKDMRSFDNFLLDNGMDDASAASTDSAPSAGKSKFLQQHGAAAVATETEWSPEDSNVVKRAMKSASAFVQSRHGDDYYPAYNSQSGEIVGVLQQLKEEMEADLSESQKREIERAEAFADLRAAKMQEIASGEKRAEDKEDQLANQANALAEAKEDLEKEEASLSAGQKFLKNLKETCTEADKNFETRKAARLEEMTAISQTIAILQGDKARDAMSGTFSFVQVALGSSIRGSQVKRHQAAQALRKAAQASNDPQLSILATSVELDAFTRVKKAIDDMIAMLKQQQVDEVKKTDWCKSEFQGNDMATSREQTEQENLEAAIAKLESDIKALETGIADAHGQIAKTQVDLQTASEERKAASMDFQKVVADQTTTVEVLHKALDKLATYYDLVQTKGSSWIQRQTPEVPQMEYTKSKGASGVMEMIEKLINDAKALMADSKHSENEAQAAYEQLIADTNASVEALQKEILAKMQAKAGADRDRRTAQSDLSDTMKELDGLAKYNAELHAECDYVLKNLDVRQGGRGQEIEALQQAKQILSGASLS